MASNQTVTLQAKGLQLSPNELTLPDGSLVQASNVVIRRDNVIEPRRGVKLYGNSFGINTDRSKQLLDYRNRILRHYGDKIQYDDGVGLFTTFAGSYTETETGLRIKSSQSNGNLYFTTSSGIKKISAKDGTEFTSASGYITNAGGIKAINQVINLSTTYASLSDFLPSDSAVAYRHTWSTNDVNGNTVQGTPSDYTSVYNPLLNLILDDYNKVLNALANVGYAGGGTLTDTNYPTSTAGQVTYATTAQDLQTKIGLLCTKIDSDIGGPSNYHSSIYSTGDTEYPTPLSTATLSLPANHDDLLLIQHTIFRIISKLKTEIIAHIPSASQTAFIQPLGITTTSNVKLRIYIPSGIDSNYYVQVYRSNLAQALGTTNVNDIVPDDEMRLTYEAYPTSTEIAQGYMDIIDETPEGFLGANLYTNPSSGEGILNANEPPPFATDINRFKNVLFYSNTKTRHRYIVNLTNISDLSSTSRLTIANDTTSTTYKFASGLSEITQLDFTGVSEASFVSTTRQYFTINSAGNVNKYKVIYHTPTATTDPTIADDEIVIRVYILAADTTAIIVDKTVNAMMSAANDFITTEVAGDIVQIETTGYGRSTDTSTGTLPAGVVLTITQQGEGEDTATNQVLISPQTSIGQAIDETAQSLIRVINANPSSPVYAYYISTTDSTPGQIRIENKDLSDTPFYIISNNSGVGSSFVPASSPTKQISSVSVANPAVVTTSTAHGLTTGQKVVISGSTTTPSIDGVRTVTVLTTTTFSIPVNVTVSPAIVGNVVGLIPLSDAEVSDNEDKSNRVYYSKFQQPEAVPLVNYFDVGREDKKILRIFPLRDSLFVFKEDGLYRISGETAPFNLALQDSSCILLAPDSVDVVNNTIYGWTTQGITSVSEAGVNIVSRSIDTEVLKVQSSSFTNFKTATFGIGYDSDNSYIVWTVASPSDTVATIAHRFSNMTNSWTTYDFSHTCGVILSADDKLYLGSSDTNYIEQERKNFDRTDYADREHSSSLDPGMYYGTTLQLSDVSFIEVGDVVTQTQAVTIYEFNALLKKLDLDVGLPSNNYYSTLQMQAGQDLAAKLDLLLAKLTVDTGDAAYAALSPTTISMAGILANYNAMIALLNVDTVVAFANYQPCDTETVMEMVVTSVTPNLDRIGVNLPLDLIVDDLTIYKAIKSEITYAPITFGDVLNTKHIREATVMFSNKAFTSASLGFSTDILPEIVLVPFNGDGNGIFGMGTGTFGSGFFGGASSAAPFRTYVPRDKQRCRFINVKFQHNVAREGYSLLGVTLTGRTGLSSRGYR